MVSTDLSLHVKQQLKRLDLLHRIGLFGPLPEEISLKQAASVAEFRNAFKLVYRLYLKKKYILPTTSELRVRIWETFSQNGVFICQKQRTVFGVTGTIMDSKEMLLPSDHAFHDELNELRSDNCLLCEVSNQAIDPEFRRSAVVTELMRAAYGHAWFSGITDLVCAVSPQQRPFFSLMGFRQVGDVRSYSDEVHDPVALLVLSDIQDRYAPGQPGNKTINEFWHKFYITENPYIPVFPFWQKKVNALFSNSTEMESLFGGCPELFETLNNDEWKIVEKNIGIDVESLAPNRAMGN